MSLPQVRRAGLHGAARQLLQRWVVVARHQVQRQEAHRVRGDDDVDGDGGDREDEDVHNGEGA